jgi:hypothetical protein
VVVRWRSAHESEDFVGSHFDKALDEFFAAGGAGGRPSSLPIVRRRSPIRTRRPFRASDPLLGGNPHYALFLT